LNAGIPQTVCTSSVTLTGSYSGNFSGTPSTLWTQTSGPSATITSAASLSTTVTGLVGGNTYVFRLSSTCADGSPTYDEVTISVSNFPTAFAGNDTTICTGTTKLNATALKAGETGVWSTISGGNGITFASSTNPKSNITLAAGVNNSGTAVFRWTVTSTATGCTAYDDVTITKYAAATSVTATASATLYSCYNTTTQATLNGSASGGGTTGEWVTVSGPNTPTFSNKNAYNTTASNLIQGTYVFRWTVTTPCVSGSATETITVPAPTGAASTAQITVSGIGTLTANQTLTLCDKVDSIVLVGSTYNTSNETVTWSVSGTGSLRSTNTRNTVLYGLNGINSATVTYTINRTGGCSSSATGTIAFEAGQTLGITNSKPLVLGCGSTSTTINVSQTGTATPQWAIISTPSGSVGSPTYTNFSTNATTSFNLTGLSLAGTYTIRVRKAVGSCSTIFDDINIIVSQSPSASNAGSDQALACNITSGELVGNTPSVGTGRWSQISGPNTATLATPTAPKCIVSGLSAGLYQFRWTISGGINCLDNYDDVFVRIASTIPSAANAGADQAICNSTPLYLSGNTPASGETGTWTVSPSTGITFSNANSPTAVASGLASSSTYTFTWTISNRCGSTADNMIATTSATVGPIAALAGADQCLSSGTTTATLAGNNPSPGTGLWTKLSGGSATVTNASLYNTTVTGLSNGTYTFEWAITRNSCTITRDTVTITISAAATTANAGADQLAVCGTTATFAGNTPTTGTGRWTQLSGGTVATITDPANPTSTVTGLSDGQYIFRWTISNGACSSNSDDVTLYVSTPPTAPNAGSDAVVCNGSTYTMAGNQITTGTGFWNLESGPNAPTITNNLLYNTAISGLIAGTYKLTWNSRNGLCYGTPDTVAITVIPTANAGSDQTICGTTSVSLVGNVNTNGTWSILSPAQSTEVITQLNGYSAIITNLKTATAYTFKYTLSDGSCNSSDNAVINVLATPTTADAGTDQTVCITDGSASTAITLAGNSPSVGTGSWTRSPSTGTISSASAYNATVTGLTPGLYTYTWTISNGNCTSADVVLIRVSKVTAKSAGADQSVCGSTATLAAEAVTSGIGTWSQVSGPNTATITSTISNTSTVTGLINGTYVFRWTVTDGGCTGASDDMQLTVATAPTTPNAGADQTLCNATSTTLAGNTISTGTGTWSQISGPNTATITSANSPTSTLTGLIPGTYVFQWTATNGSCASLTDQMTITNYNLPTTANAGADFHACLYSTLSMEGNAPTYGTGLWSQVSGNSVTFTSPTSPTSTITGAIAGTYVFRWTISNGNCTTSSDDVTVTIDNPTTIANAGTDQTITNNYTTMTANTILVGSGLWTKVSGPSGGTITSPTAATTTVTNLSSGTYVFRWTATNISCSSYDEVTVIYNGTSCIISNKMIQHKLR
jgi:hypothetical protein